MYLWCPTFLNLWTLRESYLQLIIIKPKFYGMDDAAAEDEGFWATISLFELLSFIVGMFINISLVLSHLEVGAIAIHIKQS